MCRDAMRSPPSQRVRGHRSFWAFRCLRSGTARPSASRSAGLTRQVLAYVGFFGGLGVLIVFLAAFALGRFAVGVRKAEQAAQAVTPDEEHATTAVREPERETAGLHRFRWYRSRHAGA